jgi:hypothetical protein
MVIAYRDDKKVVGVVRFRAPLQSLKDFSKETDAMSMETAFYESELIENEIVGNIAHVWVHMKQISEKWTSSKRINGIQLSSIRKMEHYADI